MLSSIDFKGQKLLLIGAAVLLVAILAAFFGLQQQKKGANSMEAIQDSIVSAAMKNDTVRKNTTIVNYMEKNLKDKVLGDYKFDTAKAYFINVDGASKVETSDGDLGGDNETTLVIPAGSLSVAFIPNKALTATGVVAGVNEITKATGAVDKHDYAKGFVTDGYIAVFGAGWDEAAAKDFAEKFFPAGSVVHVGAKYGVANSINQ